MHDVGAIELAVPAQQKQASIPQEEVVELANSPPAVFGYLLDLPGRRVEHYWISGEIRGAV